MKTTLHRRATQPAKDNAEERAPQSTPGVTNTMAIARPGKQRHEDIALVANRNYGLNGVKGQTTIPYPYGTEGKVGADSARPGTDPLWSSCRQPPTKPG